MRSPLAALVAAAALALSPSAPAGPIPMAPVLQALRVPYVRLSSRIDERSVESTIGLLNQAAKLPGAGLVVLEINSPGGSVDAGFELARAIELLPISVHCVVDGQAASEAFYILQSCDHRYITRRSALMAHEPYIELGDGAKMTRGALEELADLQDHMSLTWSEHAGAKLKLTVKEFKKKIRHHDWWMTADEALAAGAVDEVVPAAMDVAIRLGLSALQQGIVAPPAPDAGIPDAGE